MGAPSSAKGERPEQRCGHEHTESVFWGRKVRWKSRTPWFSSCSGLSLWQWSDGVSQALSLTRAFPAGSSQSPSPGSTPSCQQDHTCHLLQLITCFCQNAILYRLIISPFWATAPWSASWGLPAFQRCGYNR